MSQLTKRDLENLLRPTYGIDLVVESFTSNSLTEPGENFGSMMLALEIELLQGKQEKVKQNLSLVAKLPPPSPYLKRLFDIENTFYKEIICYIEVKGLYDKFQQEMGISKDKFLDVFPVCYGARTTLSHEIGDVADENVVLLLENLKASQYDTVDRRKGLDYKHMHLAISHLARFHATSVAVKILKPEEFEKIIIKACRLQNFNISEKESDEHNHSIIKNISAISECKGYVERVKERIEDGKKAFLEKIPQKANEPYAALVHLDFWSNNMMFSYDYNKDPVKIKFLDFQGVKYDSPAKDLIFFLYSSAADGVMPKYYDEFIKIYYENFVDCLKNYGCDTTPFTFESFTNEINDSGPKEAIHILFMLMIICADRNDVVRDISEVRNDNIITKSNPIYEKRVTQVILDFVKRGWL